MSAVAAQLQALSVISEASNIIDIEFGDMSKDLVSIKVKIKEEVDLIKFDGT